MTSSSNILFLLSSLLLVCDKSPFFLSNFLFLSLLSFSSFSNSASYWGIRRLSITKIQSCYGLNFSVSQTKVTKARLSNESFFLSKHQTLQNSATWYIFQGHGNFCPYLFIHSAIFIYLMICLFMPSTY